MLAERKSVVSFSLAIISLYMSVSSLVFVHFVLFKAKYSTRCKGSDLYICWICFNVYIFFEHSKRFTVDLRDVSL